MNKIFGFVRFVMQRIFRKDHIADLDLFDLDLNLALYIYPRIKAFVKAEKPGYPGYFAEYLESEWKSREEYDKAVKEGKIAGGGAEAWNAVLQEILFAFEWKVLNEKSDAEPNERAHRGFELFGRFFEHLWI
jgi:hypothetical protein